MIDAGKYRARAVEWGFGYAQTGTPQIAVVFDVLDLQGQQITWYGYFTDKTTERTMESLRHCGWTCDRLDQLTGMGSQEVSLIVEHETDEKGTRARVKWVNAGGNGIGLKQQMDAGQLATFAAQMRGAALASMPKPGSASSPRPQQRAAPPRQQSYEPPPHGDADIPF